MASRIKYSEEFKKKVVSAYEKGDISIEGIAEKYGIPTAIIQDWINKERVDDCIISVVSKPENEVSIVAKANTKIKSLLQKIKANGWLLVCCLPLMVFLVVSLSFNRRIVESEWNDNRQIIEEKLDTLITVNNELNENTIKMGLRLENIDNEIELKLRPSVTINNDNRKQSAHKTKIEKKTIVKEDVDEEVGVNYPVNIGNDSVVTTKSGVISDSCCCRCYISTLR